jgi:hypothetical protein
MENDIVGKFLSHKDFNPTLQEAIKQVCKEYEFEPALEIARRTIYRPDKLWRYRVDGTWEGRHVMLRIENLKLDMDEEDIRRAFRQQCVGHNVRPPMTFVTKPFDEARGYAFSIEERVQGKPIFDPTGDPEAIAPFAIFYQELRQTVTQPFWDAPGFDAFEYSNQQAEKWFKLALELYPEHTSKVEPLVQRLKGQILERLKGKALCFQHPHLSGGDVLVTPQSEFVVFANHMWRWGQPGYDLAFPIWHMWMSLPYHRRNPDNVKQISQAWLEMIKDDFPDLTEDVQTMLLNRLLGSLLLDVPAKLATDPQTEVDKLERALNQEAERLLHN